MMDETIDRAAREVEQQITLPALMEIANDGVLPADMTPSLAVVVSLARMLMVALQQNQVMAQQLKLSDEPKIIVKH